MPPLVPRSRPMCPRIPLAALVLFALVLGGAARGYAETPASSGVSMAAASTPAPVCSSDTEQSSPQSAQDILDSFDPGSAAGAYTTTAAYVAQFYPLWFTYHQAQVLNKLVGPEKVTPIYQAVVLINVDTIYASAFLDLTAGPVILTVPETPANYSILLLDPYGDIFGTTLQPNTPGVYALTGPGFSGALPPGVTRVAMPLNAMTSHLQGRPVCTGQFGEPLRGSDR